MIGYAKLYLGFFRPYPTLLFVSIFLMSAASSGVQTNLFYSMLGAFIVSLIWHAGTTYNDMTDIAIDKISNPERPLAKDPKMLRQAKRIVIVDIFLIASTTLYLGLEIFVASILMTILLCLYSAEPLRFKKHRYATLTQGFMAATSSFVGIAITRLTVNNAFLLALSFVILSIFSVVKDFKDVRGDKKEGIRTLPVIIGDKRAASLLQTVGWALFIPVLALKEILVGLPPLAVTLIFLSVSIPLVSMNLLKRGRINGNQMYKIGTVSLIFIFYFAV